MRSIAQGELLPGDRLPGEEEIAQKWGVSRQTAHKSLQDLQRQGLVVRKRRWGTVVASQIPVKTGRVGFLVDRYVQQLNFPPGDLIRGIHAGLGEDLNLVISESKDDWETEARRVRKLQAEVDGIIMYPTSNPHNTALLQRTFDSGFPLVVLDRFPGDLKVDAVVSDNEGATLEAIRALEARGHRRIGFFSFYKPDFSSVHERHAAYTKALAEVGIEDPTPYTRWLHRQLEHEPQLLVQSVYDSLYTLLRPDEPITAVFCVEDVVASAVLQACERLQLMIPEDLEIATFNDWPPLMLRTPWTIHRIVQNSYEMGNMAARLLLERMQAPSAPPCVARTSATFFAAETGPLPVLVGKSLP